MVVSYAVWTVAFSFEVFLIARVIGGLSHGNVSLSTAIVADVTPPKSKQRARGMVCSLCRLLFAVLFFCAFVAWQVD